MANSSGNMMKRRIHVILALFLIFGFGILILRLYYLQVICGEELEQQALSRQMRATSITANRGTIYDRKGNVLAQSGDVWNVILSPNDIQDEEERQLIADGLSAILGVDRDRVLELSRHEGSYYERVKRKVDKETADKVMAFADENDIISINLEGESKRFYPYGSLASTVLGFTNNENVGAYGLESYYDKTLSGIDGMVVSAKNAVGSDLPFRYQQMYDAQDGNSLVLTLDEKIQHFLDKHLEMAVLEHGVKERAAGIVMNIKTGEILAMSSKPDFDPNDPYTIANEEEAAEVEWLLEQRTKAEEAYDSALASAKSRKPGVEEDRLVSEDDSLAILRTKRDEARAAHSKAKQNAQFRQWRNKAISDPYEPGSVFKLITAAGALESHIVSAHGETFHCPGYYVVAGRRIGCWKWQGHGDLDFAGAIRGSCNPVFMMVGQRMGADLFRHYQEAFGLTEGTGIDLPGEANSYLHPMDVLSNKNMASLSSASFGQTFKVTPIQLITAVSAAIGGGNVMQPYLVSQILDSDGNVVSSTQPIVKRQAISAETSRELALLAEQVVIGADGSGKKARIPGYRIGGKTGTSEKIDSKTEDGEIPHILSFYGFAPADDPQIGVLVMLDEPEDGGSYGSTIAAPVVGAILGDILPYLGIEPQYTAQELAQTEVKVPYLVSLVLHDAQSSLVQAGLKCRIIGNGTRVLRQIPGSGQSIPRGSTVVVYTEDKGALDQPLDLPGVTGDGKIIIPSVIGMSGQQANRTILNAGLNIRLDGTNMEESSSVAVEQKPAPGTVVEPGTVVTVTFAQGADPEAEARPENEESSSEPEPPAGDRPQ